jgi:hypothetical protein
MCALLVELECHARQRPYAHVNYTFVYLQPSCRTKAADSIAAFFGSTMLEQQGAMPGVRNAFNLILHCPIQHI